MRNKSFEVNQMYHVNSITIGMEKVNVKLKNNL